MLGLQIQSLIARTLDKGKHVPIASIELNSAFDTINIYILLTRWRLVDLIDLIRIWLSDRCFYVKVDGLTSTFYNSTPGTIQGSILGPILYAIYVSPIFD